MIFLLKNKGSKKDVKKAAVENIANVTEIFDCSIPSKNVIQCNAIIKPKNEYLSSCLSLIFKLFFFNNMKKMVSIDAINILCQTMETDEFVISSPNTAVKPAIKTKKCK